MAIPRPRICTRITVPTGGWTFKIYLSDPGGAPPYDVDCTATIAAGDYFISDDDQDDDLLREVRTKMQAQMDINLAGSGINLDIHPTSHKVRVKFRGAPVADAAGDNDVKLAWTECTQGLCDALGFDSSADDTSTDEDYPVFTADWHVSHNWYSDEDGQLLDLNVEDESVAHVIQGTSPMGGKTKTQYFGERFEASLSLQYLERDLNGRTKVYSQGIGYGVASVHPYNRNEPLECWWEEARQGIEFRVYRNGNRDTSRAEEQGTSSAGNATTTTDASKSWETDPQRWKNRLYHLDTVGAQGTTITYTAYITSHTATVLTFNAAPFTPHTFDPTYFLFDHAYQTYVVNLDRMDSFAPREYPQIDRYRIKIPLKRYVA